MSTIRPLATIAVLAALGVFLAFKINEGPVVALNEEWPQPTEIDGAPAAPAWGSTAESTAPTAIEVPAQNASSLEARTAPSWAEANEPSTGESEAAPGFPALPELPSGDESGPSFDGLPPIQGKPPGSEVATEPATTPAFPTANTFPAATNEPLTPPDNIPQARYGDSASNAANPPAIVGSVPSLGASTGPYGAGVVTAPSGFSAAWEAIQTALERDELPRAHRMLSEWRGDAALSPSEQQQVATLLDQLAGTVVYSTDHRLEPAHVVVGGETLATIAQKYEVPWQLLAKINGVAASDAVTPGQTLKVVRGPFDAEVDLQRGELVVTLDGRYAGKFPIRVEGAAPAGGDWRVGQKRLDETRTPLAGAAVPVAAAVDPKMVLESPAGERVELSAGPNTTPTARGRLTIASNDLADLYDILSVGSSVTIRR